MNKMTTRLLSILLVLALALALVSCGQTPQPDDNSAPVSDVSPTTPEATDDLTTTTEDVSVDTTETADDMTAAESTTTTADTSANNTSTTTGTQGTTKPSTTKKAPCKDTTRTTATTTGKVTETTAQKTTEGTTKPTTTTTTKRTKKTVTGKTTTTTTTEAAEEEKTIRILAVGNSFSKDAMHNHLYQILESAGYTNIILGNLYIGGCSIDKHWNNALSDMNSYEFYYNTSGSWKTVADASFSRGLNFAEWDIITVQQASPDSGKPNSYSNLTKLVDWIRTKKPRADIYFHMTWAYQQDSTHSSFPNYNKDQMTMYNAICSTVQAKVSIGDTIQGVIPCGTTIQNLRTSSLGDTLTADGYHLKDSYGDYAAALTWYCYLLDGKPEDISYRPYSIEGHFDEIAESVVNAIKAPYKVTSCS